MLSTVIIRYCVLISLNVALCMYVYFCVKIGLYDFLNSLLKIKSSKMTTVKIKTKSYNSNIIPKFWKISELVKLYRVFYGHPYVHHGIRHLITSSMTVFRFGIGDARVGTAEPVSPGQAPPAHANHEPVLAVGGRAAASVFPSPKGAVA